VNATVVDVAKEVALCICLPVSTSSHIGPFGDAKCFCYHTVIKSVFVDESVV
jgi:hypothetical protein